MVSMSIYTVLTPYENQWYDFKTRNFANPIHAKIGAATIMQEATPTVGNLLSKCIPLKWDSILIKRIYGLIHSSLVQLMCFQQRFVLVLTVFTRFWYKYICFDPNYRMVVVASIQMLLARWILDIAYFRHYYHYGNFLSIIGICNPKETSCYARPASVIINCNMDWNVGLAEAEHHHATIGPSSPSTPILWLLFEYWMFRNWKTG